MLSLKHITLDGGRPPITQAINSTLTRYERGERETGHVVPPRVGKSSIIRGIAIECSAAGAPFVLCLVPWLNLAEQICDVAKTKDFMRFYGVKELPFVYSSQAIKKIPHGKFYEYKSGTPTLLSCTISLAQNAAQVVQGDDSPLISAIRRAKYVSGKAPVIILDEVQVVAVNKPWGKVIRRLQDAGAYIVTLTGTEVRADLAEMPGFEVEEKDTGETREFTQFIESFENEDGVAMNSFNKASYKKMESKINPIGGVNVGWERAWNEGWLLRTNVIEVDTIENIGGEEKKLSELSKKELQGNLSNILRGEKCVAKSVEALLKRLSYWRRLKEGKRIQALVITGSDQATDRQQDWHAREVRRVIETEAPLVARNGELDNLEIAIATSNDAENGPDDKSTKLIERFVAGEIDILIVKMMGLVGLDAPQCMVNLNLSNVRCGPLFKQANSRQLTPWTGVCEEPADLILPWDVGAQEAIEKFREQGGVAEDWKHESDLEQYDLPVKERELSPERETVEALIHGYSDEEGNQSTGENEALLYAIKSKYKIGRLTDPEILGNYDLGGYPVTEVEKQAYFAKVANIPEVINLTKQAEKDSGQFGKRARKHANKIAPYVENKARYLEVLSVLQDNAKAAAKCYQAVPTVQDPDMIEDLMTALDDEYLKLRSGT